MICPQCDSTLLTDVFKTQNPVRCATCGQVSLQQTDVSNQASKYASRSFWLGLTSIVLLFLTGIPAIWYGIRSLLQMRFGQSITKDRKRAVIGTSMGFLFGVIVSGPVVLIGISALSFILLWEETKEPERVQELLSMIGTIDVPVEFDDIEANAMAYQFQRISWRDGNRTDTASGRVRLLRAVKGSQMDSVQLAAMTDMRLHRNIDLDWSSRKTESLKWYFEDKEQDIERTTMAVKAEDFKVVQYAIDTRQDESNYVALSACIRTPGKYSEEDIRKIFESFERAKTTADATR